MSYNDIHAVAHAQHSSIHLAIHMSIHMSTYISLRSSSSISGRIRATGRRSQHALKRVAHWRTAAAYVLYAFWYIYLSLFPYFTFFIEHFVYSHIPIFGSTLP